MPTDSAVSADRTTRMYTLYQGGATLDEVGRQFGLSRERVRQIFKDADLPVRSVAEAYALQRRGLWSRSDDVVDSYLELHDIERVAERLNMPESVVKEIVAAKVSPANRRRLTRHPKKYSNEELVACLREARDAVGGILAAADYNEYAASRRFRDGRPWPTHQTHFNRWGSWRAALEAAGLPANPPSAIAGQRLFEPAQCIDALRHAARELGKVPTAAEYERLARESDGALPSQATVRNRLGRWYEALAKAGL